MVGFHPHLAELLVSLGFLLLMGVLLFSRAMGQPFSHDEHQFVASGWWLARAGLIPYRDFPATTCRIKSARRASGPVVALPVASARLVSWVAGWRPGSSS
jgi:hypothetical protein